MSFTVSTPASIVNSPLNNSTSKFQFSFPRAKKLPDPKEPVCTKAFYDLPPTRSNRSAGFGYGTKHDFTKAHDVIPPPGTYSVKDHFSPQGRRGWSIALGRESMSGNGSPENRSPGPAIYDVREKNRTHISFSFRPKTREAQPTYVKAPGPGAYTPAETLNKTGNYFVSKFKSSGVTRFNPGTSKRFIVITDGDKPGPGAYEPQTKFSPKGSYFVSTFRTSLGKSFGGRSNSTSFIQTSSTPGPGSYRLPSDFGHYESATIHRRPRSKAGKKE